MTDLLQALPDFPTHLYSHLLPSLDKHLITLSDLLTLDASDIARRAQLPPSEVRKLTDAALKALHGQLGLTGQADAQDQPHTPAADEQWHQISTLSPALDAALNGGIPTAHLTEFVGESAAGKTQFLLTLLLAVQLPRHRGGLAASAIYISTESPLRTARLARILRTHPRLAGLPPSDRPSLDAVLTLQTPDVEAQDHILRYQLPVAIARHNVKLVVIDSIASNYRAEFDSRPDAAARADKPDARGDGAGAGARATAMAARRAQLQQLGAQLRGVARAHGVAVVVANQVSDRFGARPPNALGAGDDDPAAVPPPAPGPSPDDANLLPPTCVAAEPMTLDHQQRFFTGWGDGGGAAALKTPALGLVWANQISARVALVRHGTPARRYMRVVFAAWAAGGVGRGTGFEIWEGGVRGLGVGEGGEQEGAQGGDGRMKKRKRAASDSVVGVDVDVGDGDGVGIPIQ